MNERIAIFDALKGVAILLLIVGNHAEGVTQLLIYGFHIPLFIFVSGYFYEERGIKQAVVADLKRLIMPYFIVCGVLVLWDLYTGYVENDFFMPLKRLVSYVLGATEDTEHFYSVGSVWLLFCMFWCKTVYNFISKRVNFLIAQNMIFAISIITVILKDMISIVPFCLIQGLNVMLLYNIGYCAKEFNALNIKIRIHTVIITCLTIFVVLKYGGLDIMECKYELYPVEIINASLICFLLYKALKFTETKHLLVSKLLALTGRHFILILCVHTVVFLKLTPVLGCNVYCAGIIDVALSLGIAYICQRITQIKRNFSLSEP